MAIIDRLKVVLSLDGEKFRKGINTVSGGLKSLSGGFKSLKKTVLLPFAALIAIGAKSVHAFAMQERAEKRLETAIISTGKAAGFTAEELKKRAAELQKLTTFGDEAIIEAQSRLLTFVNVQGKVFDDATKTLLDVSASLGTGLNEEAIRLGKALNDPIQGVSALTEVGVSFTEQQKEQIKVLAESGKVQEAQGLILAELRKEFGGTAEELAKGTGVFVQLSNSIGDFWETIGKSLTPVLAPLARRLRDLADSVTTFDFTPLSRAVANVQVGFVGLIASISRGKNNFEIAFNGMRIALNEFIIGGKQKLLDFGRTFLEVANKIPGVNIDVANSFEGLTANVDELIASSESLLTQNLELEKANQDLTKSTEDFADELLAGVQGMEESNRQLENRKKLLKSTEDATIKAAAAEKMAAEQRAARLEKERQEQTKKLLAGEISQEDFEGRFGAGAVGRAISSDIEGRAAGEERLGSLQAQRAVAGDESARDDVFGQFERGEISAEEFQEIDPTILAERLRTEVLQEEQKKRNEAIIEAKRKEVEAEQSAAGKLTFIDKMRSKMRLDTLRQGFDQIVNLSKNKNKQLAAVGKIAAIARTTIDTFTGAQAAYTSLAGIPVVGPALGAAAAAAAVIDGGQRVQQIREVTAFKFGGPVSGGFPGKDSVPAMLTRNENVLDNVTLRNNPVSFQQFARNVATQAETGVEEILTNEVPIINVFIGGEQLTENITVEQRKAERLGII